MVSKTETRFLKELFTKDEEKREHGGDIAQVLLLAYDHLNKLANVAEEDKNLKHLATSIKETRDLVKEERVFLTESIFIDKVFSEAGPSMWQRIIGAVKGNDTTPDRPQALATGSTQNNQLPVFSGSRNRGKNNKPAKIDPAQLQRKIAQTKNEVTTANFQTGQKLIAQGIKDIGGAIRVLNAAPGSTGQDEQQEFGIHAAAASNVVKSINQIKQGLESVGMGYSNIGAIYDQMATNSDNQGQYKEWANRYFNLGKSLLNTMKNQPAPTGVRTA